MTSGQEMQQAYSTAPVSHTDQMPDCGCALEL